MDPRDIEMLRAQLREAREPDPELLDVYNRGFEPRDVKTYGRSNWGSSFEFTGNSTAPQVLADVRVKQPRLFTVTLAWQATNSGITGRLLPDANDAFAILEYGTAGGRCQVEVDIGQGFNCQVYGDFVRVSVFYPLFIGPGVLPGAPPSIIAAAVCPGAAKSNPVYRTVYYSDLNPGANQARLVPALAEWAYASLNSAGGQWDAQYDFEQAGFATRVARYFSVNSSTAFPEHWAALQGMPVPANATSLRIRNVGPGAYNQPFVRYRLSL